MCLDGFCVLISVPLQLSSKRKMFLGRKNIGEGGGHLPSLPPPQVTLMGLRMGCCQSYACVLGNYIVNCLLARIVYSCGVT
jgi:hypothetical protein